MAERLPKERKHAGEADGLRRWLALTGHGEDVYRRIMDVRLIAEICAGFGVLGTVVYMVVGWRFVAMLKDRRRQRDMRIEAPGTGLRRHGDS